MFHSKLSRVPRFKYRWVNSDKLLLETCHAGPWFRVSHGTIFNSICGLSREQRTHLPTASPYIVLPTISSIATLTIAETSRHELRRRHHSCQPERAPRRNHRPQLQAPSRETRESYCTTTTRSREASEGAEGGGILRRWRAADERCDDAEVYVASRGPSSGRCLLMPGTCGHESLTWPRRSRCLSTARSGEKTLGWRILSSASSLRVVESTHPLS